MQWEGETFLVPVKSTFELIPCDLFPINFQTPWLASLVAFFDIIPYFLDVMLFNKCKISLDP